MEKETPISQQLQEWKNKNEPEFDMNNQWHRLWKIIQQVEELEKLYKATQIGRNNDRILEYNKRKQQIEEFKKEINETDRFKLRQGCCSGIQRYRELSQVQQQWIKQIVNELADKHFGGKK